MATSLCAHTPASSRPSSETPNPEWAEPQVSQSPGSEGPCGSRLISTMSLGLRSPELSQNAAHLETLWTPAGETKRQAHLETGPSRLRQTLPITGKWEQP